MNPGEIQAATATSPFTPIFNGLPPEEDGLIGFIRDHGPGFEAFDTDKVPLGMCATFSSAAEAIWTDCLGGTPQSRVPLLRPTALKPRLESIPHELKGISNWVMWKYEPPKKPDGKWQKVPYQPNGYKASTTNRHTWSKFEACRAVYEQGGYDGVGFVFDGIVGPDGTCLVGIDLDRCIDNRKIQHFALERIKRLGTYTEASPSGTGLHLIARTEPVESVKTEEVELYTTARYFTFTGRKWDEESQIRIATAEVRALVAELKVKAKTQHKPSASIDVAGAFKHLDPDQRLAAGLENEYWYDRLRGEQKDEVVDHALEVIASKTRYLELGEDGGNNDQWYRLVTAVARSGAPNAENIFIKYASAVKNADPEDALREKFIQCQKNPRGITVGTLLWLALEHGADFEPWRSLEQEPQPSVPTPTTWDPAELRVSYSKVRHRPWLYGTYLMRGEVTIIAAPGGVGKTALTTGIGTAIAVSAGVLDDKIWGDNLKVLSINGEDGKEEVTRRMWAFACAHAHQIAVEAPDRFYAIGAEDDRVQRMSFLRTNVRNTSTLDTTGFAILESALDAIRPDVVMLDPFVVFCSGGNMNDNAVMAQVMRRLKSLAIKYDCSMLVVHHNKKHGERDDPESIGNAAAIVNLARCAIMPVPMTKEEAKEFEILPSERHRYFRLVNAKPNFTPKSEDSPWYRLHSVEIPNPEPPLYEYGDNVQAVVRVTLPLPKTAAEAAENEKVQHAILDLVERGKLIDGVRYPYSGNVTGARNMRALLDDAMAAVKEATPLRPRPWHPDDLRAVVHAAIDRMKVEGQLFEGTVEKGRFRGSSALYVRQQGTPWSNPASPTNGGSGVDTPEEEPEDE